MNMDYSKISTNNIIIGKRKRSNKKTEKKYVDFEFGSETILITYSNSESTRIKNGFTIFILDSRIEIDTKQLELRIKKTGDSTYVDTVTKKEAKLNIPEFDKERIIARADEMNPPHLYHKYVGKSSTILFIGF